MTFANSQAVSHSRSGLVSTDTITHGNRTDTVVHLKCTFSADQNGATDVHRRLVYRSSALVDADGRPYVLPRTTSVKDVVVHTSDVGVKPRGSSGKGASLRSLLGTGAGGVKRDGDAQNATSFSLGVMRCKDKSGSKRYTGPIAVASLDKLVSPEARRRFEQAERSGGSKRRAGGDGDGDGDDGDERDGDGDAADGPDAYVGTDDNVEVAYGTVRTRRLATANDFTPEYKFLATDHNPVEVVDAKDGRHQLSTDGKSSG
jgi:hypothetical protein